MKNKALLFSTAVNLNETAKALESGEKHLSKTEYQKVRKAYKQLICHTLFWVLTAFLCAAGIVITGNKLSDIAEDELLKSYNATEYTSGVKAGPTTVLYTKGESYYFDTSVIGINLDSEYPNEIRIKNTISEAYKKLRSNIQFSGRDMRVLAVSSTVPDEGKSTVSVNLAISLAELGKKVIFIDADLRKNSIARRYKLSRRVKGLTHYLSGVNAFDEVVCETNVKNMHMVFAGIIPPNPAELLESVYFRELIKQLRKTYDYVVIDTPPVGAVIDGAIIGKECDGVVMVIGSGDISYKLVERAKEQFETSGSRVIGAVLNKVPTGKNGRKFGNYYGKYYGKYYGQGYGYGYGSYYGEEDEENK